MIRIQPLTGALLAAAAFWFAPTDVRSQPGERDPDFDAGGWQPGGSVGPAVALRDGSFVMVGDSPLKSLNRGPLFRILPDGRLDYRYGWLTNFSKYSVIWTLVEAPSPKGRIFVGGLLFEENLSGRRRIVAVDPQGRLDPTFEAAWDLADDSSPLHASRLAFQSDGRLVVVLEPGRGAMGINPRLFRLESDGRLDSTFQPELLLPEVNCVLPLNDGRLLVGGRFQRPGETSFSKLARLQADGRVDASFIEPALIAAADRLTNLVTLPDGLAAIAHSKSKGYHVVRLGPTGERDSAYPNWTGYTDLRNVTAVLAVEGGMLAAGPDDHGLVSIAFLGWRAPTHAAPWVTYSYNSSVAELLLEPGGNVVAVGNFRAPGNVPRPGVVRLRPDGSPDPNFGRLGPSLSNKEASPPSTINLLPLPDGRILVGGNFRYYNSLPRAGLARLLPDGALDLNFVASALTNWNVKALQLTPDGGLLVALSGPTLPPTPLVKLRANGDLDPRFQAELSGVIAINRLAVSSNGMIYLEGRLREDSQPVIRRLDSSGRLDTSFVMPVHSWLADVHPDGRALVVSGPSGLQRFLTDGTPDPSFERFAAGSAPYLSGALVLPDDSVIALGRSQPFGIVSVGAFRWHPDGRRDKTFRPGLTGGAIGGAAAPAGRFVLLGGFEGKLGVVRFLPTGAVDPSFLPLSLLTADVGTMAAQEDKLFVWIHRFEDTSASAFHVERWDNRAYTLGPPMPDHGEMILDLIASHDERHRIEASSNLTEWTEVTQVTLPATNRVFIRVPAGEALQFYREQRVE